MWYVICVIFILNLANLVQTENGCSKAHSEVALKDYEEGMGSQWAQLKHYTDQQSDTEKCRSPENENKFLCKYGILRYLKR